MARTEGVDARVGAQSCGAGSAPTCCPLRLTAPSLPAATVCAPLLLLLLPPHRSPPSDVCHLLSAQVVPGHAASPLPLLRVAVVSQAGAGPRGRGWYPFIGARPPSSHGSLVVAALSSPWAMHRPPAAAARLPPKAQCLFRPHTEFALRCCTIGVVAMLAGMPATASRPPADPCAGVRVSLPLQLALSEPLIWRMRDMAARLSAAAAASSQVEAAGAAAGAGAGDQASSQPQLALVPAQQQGRQHQAAAADVPVRIRLLTVADLATEVSFQGDPLSRPRRATPAGPSRLAAVPQADRGLPYTPMLACCPWCCFYPCHHVNHAADRMDTPSSVRRDLSGGMVGVVIDLANFTAAPVTLRGLEMQVGAGRCRRVQVGAREGPGEARPVAAPAGPRIAACGQARPD